MPCFYMYMHRSAGLGSGLQQIVSAGGPQVYQQLTDVIMSLSPHEKSQTGQARLFKCVN